jgi:peptidoglycan-associated lipoprotein
MLNLRNLLLFCFLGAVLAALGCGGRPKYPACDGDKDCQPKERCVNKKCVQCKDNMDCPEGTTCVAGGCQPTEGYCKSDSDCGIFEVCKDNRCTSCTVDEECGPGGACRAGKCIRPGTCETDEDCPEDEDCVNNRCVKSGQPSSNIPSCPVEAVYFGFDEYTLGDAAKASLQKTYDCLQANKDRTVAVVGHTDRRGTVEYNISLSDDRSQAVITYLGRLGVDPARLRKVPKGASEAQGADEAGFAKDRRVEFVWE